MITWAPQSRTCASPPPGSPTTPTSNGLLAHLLAADARFGELWIPGEVATVYDRNKTIEQPELGLLDLDCDVLTVDGADLRLVVFIAAPGTAASDSLALLASLEVRPLPRRGYRPR